MSKKLPVLKGDEVVAILKKHGFQIKRQKGSHIFLENSEGLTTVVPVHKGKDIDRSLLRKILNDCGISIDEFLENL